MNNFFKDKIFHPFLFAIFPVLFIYAQNFNLITTYQVWMPLIIVTGITILFLLINQLIFRNWYKAGLFTSIVIIAFFIYQPFFSLLQNNTVTGLIIFRHRALLIIYLFLFLGFAGFLLKSKSRFINLTYILNITAAILLIPSVLKLSWFGIQPFANMKQTIRTSFKHTGKPKPDIYYFIMDAYGRQDILKETYHYNNQPFLDALKKRNFYISKKSTSNYFKTVHSIPSALNLGYLQDLIDVKNLNNPVTISAKKLVQHSKVREILKENHYKYICYASGVDFTELENADEYFSPGVDYSELDLALINSSPIPDLLHSFFAKNMFSVHRETVLYPFDHIKDAIQVPASKFVQIHILSPHPPFVFDSNGNEILIRNHKHIYRNDNTTNKLPADYYAQYNEHQAAYVDQLKFINKKLLQAIDTILKHSKTPPVIIIQSDHGARLNCHINNIEASNHYEAFANLSAFYFPKQDTSGLYQEISPVNIFRVVINKYFGGNLNLLPDKSYYSTENAPYKFTDVTKYVKSKKFGPIFLNPQTQNDSLETLKTTLYSE